jgi:hypothetical protein
MQTLILNAEQLDATIANGRWFDGFKCRWQAIGNGKYRVRTNYVLADAR